MTQIKNGDVYDIGQTVNGVSTFLWFNDKIYYYTDRMSHRDVEYEYNQNELTQLITQDEFGETTYLGNILETFNTKEK